MKKRKKEKFHVDEHHRQSQHHVEYTYLNDEDISIKIAKMKIQRLK